MKVEVCLCLLFVAIVMLLATTRERARTGQREIARHWSGFVLKWLEQDRDYVDRANEETRIL